MSAAEAPSLTAELLGRTWLSPRVFQLELARPPGLSFAAGQRVRIHRGPVERDYTLACGPAAPTLRLLVRLVEQGVVSGLLAETRLGASLVLSGPHGYFVFRDASVASVFVATGTGVAPFVAMAASGVCPSLLLHGVKRPEDLHYRVLLSKAAARYVPCLTEGPHRPEDPDPAYPGRVVAWLRDRLPAGVYDFYLCGNAAMIRDVTLLVDERFPGSRVFAEGFH
ncbi:MAG TPA: FAD-binding oxidoreductase [Spirochaetia bacterium]|nr:FAD-binding oxidoreductase [Spirochaetia bacterium]